MLSLLIYVSIPILFICFWWIPKGNPIYELLRLPNYWYRVFKVDTSQMNITKYKYGKQRRQYFYCCEPLNGQTSKKNVVVYFHGGAWAFGAPWQFFANAQQLVHEGYCVFMPCYRRTPMYSYYDLREDITTTLKTITAVMQDKHMADKKIVLSGISAGANLAALLAFDRAELKKTGISREQISGAFFSGGPLALNKMKFSIPLWLYAGRPGSVKFKAANPINYLQADENLPVFIIHGTKDGIVEYGNAVHFANKLSEIQADLTEFYTIKEGIHVDATRWSYDDGDLRKALFDWLRRLEGV